MLATIHKGARAALRRWTASTREYSLYEIAIVTRAGPARILGIHDRHGHLGPGCAGRRHRLRRTSPTASACSPQPALLLKAGRPVMRDGEVLEPDLCGATHVVRPGYDARDPRPRRPVLRGLPRHAARHLRGRATARSRTAGAGSVVVHECGGAAVPA